MACSEKHTYDIRLILHIFMHVVSEAPGIVLKKNRKCFKNLSKFIGMWGIDNGLIVLTSKNCKIPKNI